MNYFAMLMLSCIMLFTALALPIIIFLLRLKGKFWICKMRVFTFFMFLAVSGYILINGAIWSFYLFAVELHKVNGIDYLPNNILLIILAAIAWLILPMYTVLLFPFYMLAHHYIYRRRLKREF